MIAGDLEPVGDAHAGDTRPDSSRSHRIGTAGRRVRTRRFDSPSRSAFRITVLLSSPSNSDTSSRAASSSSGIRALIDDIVYVVTHRATSGFRPLSLLVELLYTRKRWLGPTENVIRRVGRRSVRRLRRRSRSRRRPRRGRPSRGGTARSPGLRRSRRALTPGRRRRRGR